jgi:lipopolysaccharide biosynthesis regulator YciM
MFWRHVVILLAATTMGCEIKSCYEEAKEKHLNKRYGNRAASKGQLEDWEKEISSYEKVINEKIDAGIKTGKVYRKLGESYALMESYELCVKNLDKAIEYGEAVAEVFYWQGLCYANLSRVNNWQPEYAKKAEQSFLKALNLDKTMNKVKYELAVMYYAGFARNNQYRVLADTLTVSQQQFQEKAIELMKEFKSVEPDQAKAYFFLAGLYKERGEMVEAKRELTDLMKQIEKNNAAGAKRNLDYNRAEEYLKTFESSK